MSWAWGQYKDFALAIGAMFWVYLLWQLWLHAKAYPRETLSALFGGLAIVFGMLTLLWIGHLTDKYW